MLEKQDDLSYLVTNKFEKIYSWQLDEPKVNLQTDQFANALNDWYSVSEIVSICKSVELKVQIEI